MGDDWNKKNNTRRKVCNPLVLMLAISEYQNPEKWPHLKGVEERDMVNFKEIFEKYFHYDFNCNEKPFMTRKAVLDYFHKVLKNFGLETNKNEYDGLIIILCGHGDNDSLITSGGNALPIEQIRELFNCQSLPSFKEYPKIFIVDACRGNKRPIENLPEDINKGRKNSSSSEKQTNGHCGDGFITIWSTVTKYSVLDIGLLGEAMENVVMETKEPSIYLKDLVLQTKLHIRNKKYGDVYCVQTEDTILVDIELVRKKAL